MYIHTVRGFQSVTSTHCLMSNFLPWITRGRSMYFWATHFSVRSCLTYSKISWRLLKQRMPLPRLLPPGLTIQILCIPSDRCCLCLRITHPSSLPRDSSSDSEVASSPLSTAPEASKWSWVDAVESASPGELPVAPELSVAALSDSSTTMAAGGSARSAESIASRASLPHTGFLKDPLVLISCHCKARSLGSQLASPSASSSTKFLSCLSLASHAFTASLSVLLSRSLDPEDKST